MLSSKLELLEHTEIVAFCMKYTGKFLVGLGRVKTLPYSVGEILMPGRSMFLPYRRKIPTEFPWG